MQSLFCLLMKCLADSRTHGAMAGSNSPCSWEWSWISDLPACLHFPSVGITGLCHHVWLSSLIILKDCNFISVNLGGKSLHHHHFLSDLLKSYPISFFVIFQFVPSRLSKQFYVNWNIHTWNGMPKIHLFVKHATGSRSYGWNKTGHE